MSFNANKICFSAALLIVISLPAFVFALPEGENVVAGSAAFDRSQVNTLNVNTPSDRLIVNYNSFSIAQPETVNFQQPSASSIVLNRVVGVDPSSIMGTLNANGRVFIVNPNGVIFGPNSHVDVAGLVASSLNISNDDFLNGNYVFSKSGKNGYVINQGTLNAKSGGYVCLLGGAVDNRLAIQADLGTVVLASGEKITLALEDQNAISVVVDEAVQSEVFGPDGNKMTSAVKNSGTILAEGGKVMLTAKVLNRVFDYAINNTGLVKVTSLVKHDGVIELMAEGAPIINSGTLEADQVSIKGSNADLINTKEGKIIANAVAAANPDGGKISIQATSVLQQGLVSANAIELGTAGEVTITSEGNTTLDESSCTEARAMGITGNGGRISITSKTGSVFVNKNAKIDFSAGAISGNGGLLQVDAFQQLGFYGILNGRAPPGFKPGIALLDPESATFSGTIAAYTTVTVDAWRDITIAGDITLGFNATLNLYADHLNNPDNQQNQYTWDTTYDPGIGAIINTGDYLISSEDLYGTGILNLRAGSGIGTYDHPVRTNMNSLLAQINPASTDGDIFIDQGTVALNINNISSPGLVVIWSLGQLYQGAAGVTISADELYLETDSGVGSAERPLGIRVNNLIAENEGVGGIWLYNEGNVVVLAAINTAAAAATEISASGDIRVRYGIFGNGDITLDAGGSIYINTIADITAPSDATIELTAENGAIVRRNMEVLDYGMQAYWNFDQSYSYYYAEDVSGNGYSAYCTGSPDIVAGQYGGALYFDGVNDYINIGRNFSFGTGPFTLICWYQGIQSLNNVGLLGASPYPYTSGYALETHYGQLQHWINNNMTRSSILVNDGTWHQLSMVRDGTEGGLYLFNDDTREADLFPVPEGSVDSSASFWIGGWGHVKRLTQGNLDDVRVYASALSGLEIYGQTLIPPGTGEISAGNVVLNAVTGIDVAMNGVQTVSAYNSGTGSINITNEGDFQVVGDGVTNVGGNIDIRAYSNLTVNAVIAALNGGSVYLSASDDIIINNTSVYSNASSAEAAVTSGSVTLSAGSDIQVNGGSIYSRADGAGMATAGPVSLTAFDNVSLNNAIVYSSATALAEAGNVYAYANYGGVGISAYYGNISVTGVSQIYSEARAFTGSNYLSYAYAGSISLNAGGTIVVNATPPVGSNFPPLYSFAQSNYEDPYAVMIPGDISLYGNQGVTLNNEILCNNLTVESYYGPVTINAGAETRFVETTGNVTVYGYGWVQIFNSLSAGTLDITGDSINIYSTGAGEIIVSGLMTISGGYGGVFISNDLRAASFNFASGGVIVTESGVDLSATSGDIIYGDINLYAGNYIVLNGNVTGHNLTITTDYGHVTIDAGLNGQIYTTGDVDIEAGLLNGNGDITIAHDLNAQDITIYGSTITTGSLIAAGDVDVEGGIITINGDVNGDLINLESYFLLTVEHGEGYSSINALSGITIQAASDIVLDANLYSEEGDININSDSGSITIWGGDGVAVNADVGNVDITAWGNIGLYGSVYAGEDLTIESTAGSLNGPSTYGISLTGWHMYIAGANDFILDSGDLILQLLSETFSASLYNPQEGWPLGLTLVATGENGITVDADLTFEEDLSLSSGGPLSITEACNISARNITLSSDYSTLDVGGDLDAGEYVDLHSFGNMYLQNVSSGLGIDIVVDDGNLSAGNLSSGEGYCDADVSGNATVNGNITVGDYVWFVSGADMSLGSVTANSSFIRLDSGGALSVGGEVLSAGDFLEVSATGDIDLGALTSAGSYIDIFSAGGVITRDDVTAGTSYLALYADGDIETYGDLSAGTEADVYSYNGNITLGGNVSADDVYVTAANDLTVDSSVSGEGYYDLYAGRNIQVNQDISVYSMNMVAGGNIDLLGNVSAVYNYIGAGANLTLNAPLSGSDALWLYAGLDMYVWGDISALSIDMEAGNNFESEGTVTLTAMNHTLRAFGDFTVAGNTISYNEDTFRAELNPGDYGYLQNLSITSYGSTVSISEAFQRDSGIVQFIAARGININAPITMGNASLYMTCDDGVINASSDVEGAHITSSGYVYIHSGYLTYIGEYPGYQVAYSESRIGSRESPLDVLITGEGSLNVAAYGQIEGDSGVFTGTIRESTDPSALNVLNTPPGLILFNYNPANPPAPEPPQPEPTPQPELTVAPTGDILAHQPNPVNPADLSNYQFSSPIGSVFLYHPIVPTDMGALDQLALGADAYSLRDGQLQLVGHEGLLQFFQEFDQNRKKGSL